LKLPEQTLFISYYRDYDSYNITERFSDSGNTQLQYIIKKD